MDFDRFHMMLKGILIKFLLILTGFRDFNSIPIDSNGILIRFQLILQGIVIRFQLILKRNFNSISMDIQRNFNSISLDFNRNLKAGLPDSLNKYAPLIINNF